MNLFIDSHLKLLEALLQEQVEFLIIGGYAVIFYGYQRTTGDVDIWLKPDNENKEKVIQALKSEEISKESLEAVRKMDFTKHLMFSLGEAPEKVDFLTRINQVSFEEAIEKRVITKVNGLQIPFIHLSHLVLSKFNTGRAQDKADMEELQRINREQK